MSPIRVYGAGSAAKPCKAYNANPSQPIIASNLAWFRIGPLLSPSVRTGNQIFEKTRRRHYLNHAGLGSSGMILVPAKLKPSFSPEPDWWEQRRLWRALGCSKQ